jgi:hypothetical protein
MRTYKRLILFVMLIVFGAVGLMLKGEFPLSQMGHIESECLGINIPEKIKYTQSRAYCQCFKHQLNFRNAKDSEHNCTMHVAVR